MSWWGNNDDNNDDNQSYLRDGNIKKKIISLGITKYEKDTMGMSSIGNSHSPNRQFNDKKEKMAMYRDQLERDKDSKIEETRKPLKQAPNYSDVQPSYDGLRIGADTQPNAVLDRKREAQRQYHAQLAEDSAAKIAFTENAPTRGTLKKKNQEIEPKPFSVGAASPKAEPSPRYPSYDYQGTGIDIGNMYSVENQRSKALLHAAKLKEDILMRIKYSEPISEVMQAENKGYSRSSRKEEDHETYEGFYIGTDDATAKSNKKKQQQAYYQELEAAHGPSFRAPKNRGMIDTDVNITGWTGLNIGGVAADNTRSRQALNSKVSNQEKYRAQLDQQQVTQAYYRPTADIIDASAPLPYMKY